MMLRYPAGGGWLLWRPPEAGPETATWRRRWSTKRGKHTSTPRWVDRLRSFFHLSVFISGFPWGSWAWAKGSRSRWMSNDSRWCGGHQCVVNSLGSYRGLARWDEPRGLQTTKDDDSATVPEAPGVCAEKIHLAEVVGLDVSMKPLMYSRRFFSSLIHAEWGFESS